MTVEGTVTRAFGDFVRFQDESGPTGASGLVVRQPSGAFFDDIQDGTITQGTQLQVTGTLSEFNGLLQINEEDLSEYTVQGQGSVPAAQSVSLSEIDANGEDYESELVTISDLTFPDASGTFENRESYTVEDNTGSLTFRVQSSSETNIAGVSIPAQSFTYNGVVGEFRGSYQLIPVRKTDLNVFSPVPTVDGQTTDERYIELGTSPAEPGADFTGGVLTLNAFSGPDSLYVAVEGTAALDDTFREIMIFMNASSTAGIPSGDPLPPGNDGFSPFSATDSMRLDMEADYGIRFTGSPASNCSGSTGCGFVSFVNYVGFSSGDDSATDAFEAEVQPDGSAATGSDSGGSYAYVNADSVDVVDGTGLEFAIPHSALGTSQGDDFQFFAFYGDVEGDNIAATLIPDDGTTDTYGNSEDWTAVSGTQATGAQVLPVEMASFDVTADAQNAVLTWKTASETNNAGFEVQHATNEGRFQTVGFVEGAGTTQEPQSYRFRVDDLSPGTHQFRLKQMDLDGTASLSSVRTVTVSMDRSLVFEPIAPNPVRGTASFTFATREAQPVTVEVYNVLGQRVATLFSGRMSGGQAKSVQIDASDLVSGTYFVRINGQSFNETRRMTVVK